MGERSLAVDATRPRCRELVQIGQRARAPLLCLADQAHQDFRRRECVGQRAVAGLGRGAVEVRERGEADAADAAVQKPARERGRVECGRTQPPSRQPFELPVEERDVEARVVRDERRVTREGEEGADRRADSGRAVAAPRRGCP